MQSERVPRQRSRWRGWRTPSARTVAKSTGNCGANLFKQPGARRTPTARRADRRDMVERRPPTRHDARMQNWRGEEPWPSRQTKTVLHKWSTEPTTNSQGQVPSAKIHQALSGSARRALTEQQARDVMCEECVGNTTPGQGDERTATQKSLKRQRPHKGC